MNNDFLMFPNFKEKALTFSYDDGVKEDRPFVALLNKYGLKGTFNLNSGLMPEKKDENDKICPSEVKELYAGHEVAVHSVHHPLLEKMSEPMIAMEVLDDRRNLEKCVDYPVRGMAYPFGTYDDRVINVLKMCGIKYSRTVEAHRKFILPENWLKMPSTCHHADEKLFELANTFVTSGPKHQSRFVANGWLFYVWGHTYEFRTKEDWDRIEEFMKIVSFKDDVWYATNIEIHDYIEAFRALEYSVDLDRAYNPSAVDVYLIHEEKKYVIPAGKTVIF